MTREVFLCRHLSRLYMQLPLLLLLLVSSFSGAQSLGTVEFKGATVGNAARVLSELSNINIVVTESARELPVSMHLKNATVDSAVDSLCRATGLWYRKSKEFNAYYIMTEEEFNKDIVVERDYITRIFELKHQNVSDAANAIESLFGERVELSQPERNRSYELDGDLKNGGNSGSGNSNSNNSNNNNNRSRSRISVSSSGGANQDTKKVESRRSFYDSDDLTDNKQVVITEEELVKSNVRSEPIIYVTWNYLHNLLMIRSSDKQAIRDIAQLIRRIDRPAQQVMLEMQILRATLGENERSIFDYSYRSGKIATGSDSDGNPTFSPRKSLDLGRFPLEGGAFLAQLTGSQISATIEWLHTQNRINLVAQPNIIAANNKEAKLTIGEKRIIIDGAESDIVTNENTTIINIELKTLRENIGTELAIWPRINGDKTVTLDIKQSNTSLNAGSTNLPVSTGVGGITNVPIDSVSESTVELTAVARHGATIAIGGMIEAEKQEFREKVPLLGDLPVVGKMFRRDVDKDSRTELILLITPWISKDPTKTHVINQSRVRKWSDMEDSVLNSHLIEPDKSASTSWPSATRKQAVAMIREAVKSDRSPNGAAGACPANGVLQAPRFRRWQVSNILTVDALSHCRINNLFLTRATVLNKAQRPQKLMPELFKQGWIASHGESALLGPGNKRVMYFVSQKAPELLLQSQQERFFYGEEVANSNE